ncbi:U7 snRNA-associated Sm-like protein LSm11 isoform X1 [Microplitis demolitor]|uniref:U7 snRNA-associated Sm-like protein LSm11 isoform X1 n=1 Tax=Microplitis demolitor TaxID=69319 RepID=UPI0004CCFF9A|nr:U7 snRNA-associated Sm-like protein LSm11 isoform X1 [Microplitis demolitor]XP_008555748.1 U7 snRNA-associated Sm-like protein LSm11 isoform X1 [Microplitis demolitor]
MENAGSSSDESLDPTKESFDPLKALYSEKTKIPVKKAPTYDNITKFESALKGIVIKPSAKSSKKENKKSSKVSTEPKEIKAQNYDALKSGRNVLSRMANTIGPLQLIYTCMETKSRVKVYTRSVRGIRGHIEAYVAAFDKHWNLALEDCFETWTRKIKRKAPALGIPTIKSKEIEENVPKMIVKTSNGNTETLERHVPQMMLRGEQVVMIVKIN